MTGRNSILKLLLVLFLGNDCFPVDWPMWRYDAGRTAVTPENLASELHLHWSQLFTPREPVWDDPLNQDLMPYDRIFEPIVLGDLLYIGFNDCDKVAAFDLTTGRIQWEYFTDGPVRLPLAGGENKIYFSSDDGYLYCLNAKNGKLLWKFNGGPSNRKILGNKRLISMWPARGGVVLKDNIVYFAASIWPMMGTFIYALDARSGEVLWRNEETGADFIRQPHNYPAFAGIAPQGVFAIGGDYLLIPGGRSVPACFDRTTGKMRYYHLAKFGKSGGAFTCVMDTFFFNHDRDRMTNLYNLESGDLIVKRAGKYPAVTKDCFYFSGSTVSARLVANPGELLWEIDVDASGDLIMAGDYLYAGGKNKITKLLPQSGSAKPRKIWEFNVDGQVERLLAANGYLIAVTEEGNIMAFGRTKLNPTYFYNQQAKWTPAAEIKDQVEEFIKQVQTTEGYGVCYGVGNGDFLTALVMNSDLSLVGVDPDKKKIDALRKRFDALGIYGKRISLLQGSLSTVNFPQYFSSLTILQDLVGTGCRDEQEIFDKLVRSARPYDGKIVLAGQSEQRQNIFELAQSYKGGPITAEILNESLLLTRAGPLPDTDNWTHQYGDIHNSVKSDDKLVKMPLGVLWFGGNSNLDVLPRHGHGPPEQVVDGRLVIQGMDVISARDVYTGRVLWKAALDCLETFKMYYNETYTNTPLVASYNQRHIPGANGRGTNYVVSNDFVYIIQGNKCLVLDIVTGDQVNTIEIPATAGETVADWSYIGVYEDYLIAGAEFAAYSALTPLSDREKMSLDSLSEKQFTDLRDKTNYDLTASKRLLVMDRFSGNLLWHKESRYGFIHNSIVANNGRLYCLDKVPAFIEGKMERRGMELPTDYRLLALDITDGRVLWEKNNNVFGTWLGYSKEHDLLLQATRPSPDMLSGEEGERMIVYEAKNGLEKWDKPLSYDNPPILHHDKIITEHIALNLLTGEQIQREDPITLSLLPWTYTRTKGCNYNIASENLLSFRSSAAGFFDLENDGGLGHFGGFKSGCTSNLVAANGVLNAPDYTRTCQCGYQNQTSLALVHMPGVEYWTTSDFTWDGSPVRKVGLNFNAPGDRMSEEGILWLDYPSVGGPSPDIPVTYRAENPVFIRRHSWFLPEGSRLPWVCASAIAGIQEIEITLSEQPMPAKSYFIRLYFAELEAKKSGERIFNIDIQGKTVVENLDIMKEAGGEGREVVIDINNIVVRDKLVIRFNPSKSAPASRAIISGIAIIAEDLKEKMLGTTF